MPSGQTLLLSPAELAYLQTSLSLPTPIRPDGRKPTQFRPLTAETGILPGTNGSARVCFSDGTEAIVGVKAEIEQTVEQATADLRIVSGSGEENGSKNAEPAARNAWLEITVEIPGYRDDDPTTVFLASMLSEALTADGEFAKKLVINRRFHWKLYLDIFLISPPLSYPLPLLSLTTHLALLATRLPRLKSEGDEDPMFNDDWEASTYLYPRDRTLPGPRPPITLLVVSVGDNIFFDPSGEELAVAEVALAISVAESPAGEEKKGAMEVDSRRPLRLLAMRSVDPPSRLTPPGIPNVDNPTTGTSGAPAKKGPLKGDAPKGVWKAPVGGAKFSMIQLMVQQVLEAGGVADNVLDGIDSVDLA
ncbi:related to rRNA processing protein [Cephalotrichum gorgonifer]|uniref:Ribosomal RNA-processing protein 42 n=1 Tax=Cephalotrichum gorgonifer TaxID=2041049 RepID=A0AAE8MYY5_9PEZI|nr:related to rRNA processing protein [Cephalotrichum gorgonifer]